MTRYSDYLAHFNPNHDPRNGQFSSKKGAVGALQKLGYHQAHSKSGQLGLAIGKKRLERKQKKEEAAAMTRSDGMREDQRAYKYNKAGESGWKGLGRAVKANLSSSRGKAVLGATAAAAIWNAAEYTRWHRRHGKPTTIPATIISSGLNACTYGLAAYGAVKIHDKTNKNQKKDLDIKKVSKILGVYSGVRAAAGMAKTVTKNNIDASGAARNVAAAIMAGKTFFLSALVSYGGMKLANIKKKDKKEQGGV